MKKLIPLMLASSLASAVTIDKVRIQYYMVLDENGQILSRHSESHTADEALTNYALSNPGKVYYLHGAIIKASASMETVLPKLPPDASVIVTGAKVQICWDWPTSREDGTPLALSEIGGAIIEFRQGVDAEWRSFSFVDTSSTCASVANWGYGDDWELRMAVWDTSTEPLQSQWSESITFDITELEIITHGE